MWTACTWVSRWKNNSSNTPQYQYKVSSKSIPYLYNRQSANGSRWRSAMYCNIASKQQILFFHQFLEEVIQILVDTFKQVTGNDNRFLIIHNIEVGKGFAVLILHHKGKGTKH